MNFMLALLLQEGDKMGKSPAVTAPGDQHGFTRVMIMIFIVALAIGAGAAVWMVVRGAAGAAKAEVKEEEKK